MRLRLGPSRFGAGPGAAGAGRSWSVARGRPLWGRASGRRGWGRPVAGDDGHAAYGISVVGRTLLRASRSGCCAPSSIRWWISPRSWVTSRRAAGAAGPRQTRAEGHGGGVSCRLGGARRLIRSPLSTPALGPRASMARCGGRVRRGCRCGAG